MRSSSATFIEWGAIALLAIFFVPRILASMSQGNARTNAQYNPGAALNAQAARAVNTAGLAANTGLAEFLAGMLRKQQPSSSQSKPASGPSMSTGQQAKPSAAVAPPSSVSPLFTMLNNWFGDKQEAAQLTAYLGQGATIQQASRAVDENYLDVIAALTDGDSPSYVPTESSNYDGQTIPEEQQLAATESSNYNDETIPYVDTGAWDSAANDYGFTADDFAQFNDFSNIPRAIPWDSAENNFGFTSEDVAAFNDFSSYDTSNYSDGGGDYYSQGGWDDPYGFWY